MKKDLVIMVWHLNCFEFLVETLNINKDDYKITLLYDDRKIDISKEVNQIATGLGCEFKLLSARKVINLFHETYRFNNKEIIEELGCIVKPIFMSVMDQLGYEKIFIMDEDIVVLNDIGTFWDHDYACKGARFLGHYPKYFPVCQRIFGLEAEGKHQNTGHVTFKYRADYGEYFTKFFNSEEAQEWFENRKRRKGNFFYGEQGFTSYYMSAYLPSLGIDVHGFKENEVAITFNQDHDHKIAKRRIVHYPVKKKDLVIEKIRKGLELAKERE